MPYEFVLFLTDTGFLIIGILIGIKVHKDLSKNERGK